MSMQRSLISSLFLFLAVQPAHSQLVIEPVINRFEDGEDGIPLGKLLPTPGAVFAYVSGDPRDPRLDTHPIVNTTQFVMNGYGLEIIGTGTDTRDPRTIVRGPIDAIFGDVDGDGEILSDIFSSHELSADGKRLEFHGGEILPGQRFTGIHLATSDRQSETDPPIYAGIDSWFTSSEPEGITTVAFRKSLELDIDPFDPDAVWVGTGKTFGGEDVDVRAYGLKTEPAGDSVSITDFTFDITGSGIEESFTLMGTYTPTGELTGNIEITGEMGALLISSTQDGLLSTAGTIRFNETDNVGGLAGDIDGDGIVGFADFLVLSANFDMPGTATEGDLDGDGQVDFADFLILSTNFGMTVSVADGIAAVPEPTAVALLAIGSLLLGLTRRCRGCG